MTLHYPLLNNDQDPHWYNQRVREDIQIISGMVEFPLSLVKQTSMGPTLSQNNG